MREREGRDYAKKAKKERSKLNFRDTDVKGVLITGTWSNQAAKDLVHFLRRLDYVPPTSEVKEPAEKEKKEDEFEDVTKILKEQVTDEKAQFDAVKDLYEITDTAVSKNVKFVKFNSEALPSEKIHQLCSQVHEAWSDTTQEAKRSRPFKWDSRLIPADYICESNLTSFETAMRRLVRVLMPNSLAAREFEGDEKGRGPVLQEGQSWGLFFQKRYNMQTITKDDAINLIGHLTTHMDEEGKEVKSPFRVDLAAPDVAILVDLNPTFCAIAACVDYHKLKKYNLHALSAKAMKN